MKTGDNMEGKIVKLEIDVFRPATIPMSRLAEYMKAFSCLLGNEEHVHFLEVEEGSARLCAATNPVATPKVERRLFEVVNRTAPKPAMRAHQEVEDLLVADNAIGHISMGGKKVIEFVGRRRSQSVTIGPVKRSTFLDGQIFSIGGRDATINVHLRNKDQAYKCVVSIDLAKQLAPHFWGGKVRLFGEGDFIRRDEEWTMLGFTATSFVPLSNKSLSETLGSIRELFKGAPTDLADGLLELRNG